MNEFRLRQLLIAAVLVAALALSPLAHWGCGGTTEPAGSTPATTPRSAPVDAGASFRFIVCGDPQNVYEVFDTVLEAAKSVDFLIIAGDLTGSGTPIEFQRFNERMAASGVKYYAVPGNHDVATSPVSEGYARYIGKPYGSFDYRNTHFLLIDNSTPSLGFYASQRRWAADDMRKARQNGMENIIAVCHVPPRLPYSANALSDQSAGMEANEMLIPVLSEGGAKTLFCGHLHTYRQYEEDGVDVTITGGAGAPLHGANSFHHYMVVEVNGRQIKQNVVRI